LEIEVYGWERLMPKSRSGSPLPTSDDPLISHCLDVLRNGPLDDCYKIIPRMGVTKDRRVLPVLRELLFSGERCREQLAVCGLAAMGCGETLPWLFQKLRDASVFRGPGSQKLQAAILDAVGEIGDDAATD
jgi:hypothetical protein